MYLYTSKIDEGAINPNTKVNTSKAKSRAKESTIGQMGVHSMVNGKITISMDL